MNFKPTILIILFITSGIFYYQIASSKSLQTSYVQHITDGDTIKLESGEILRLEGINTPERSKQFYKEAKQFLNKTIQNNKISIEKTGHDKYGRTLAYIFLNNQNINEAILKEGLGNLYYYEKDHHYEALKKAEEFARTNQLNLWQKSPNENCIEIIEFKTDEPESLTLKNNCNIILEITYKDDANHIYQATIQPNSQYIETFSHIWNTDGDTIYIRDSNGLILFHRY